MTDRKVRNILRSYISQFSHEKGAALIKKALKRKDSLQSRKNFFAHVTASAIVVNSSFTSVLLVKHKSLGRFLQPGGHLDSSDVSFVDAARRELFEEVGIKNVAYFPFDEQRPDAPFDVDVHKIPNNPKKEEPEHYHIDCRYLFVYSENNNVHIDPNEVTGVHWVPLDRVVEFVPDFKRLFEKTREFLEISRDKIFFKTLIAHLNFFKKKFNIVAVLHIVPDIPWFIDALQSIAKHVTIIPKPNSIHKEVLQAINKKNIMYFTRHDLWEVSTLKKVFSNPEPYYVLDIGGYFANDVVISWNQKVKKIKGIIEDTENGFQKYQVFKRKIKVPVVSVARSYLKKNEDDLVGHNVAYYTEMVLRQIRKFPKYMRCGLIGYGKLGRGIAKYLLSHNIKPMLFDKNPLKMVEAHKDGCIPVQKSDILAKSDLLFCATGGKSLNENDFLNLKMGCAVASVTSSDDEFDLKNMKKRFAVKKINEYISRLEHAGGFFLLVNNGNAVNFIGGDQVGNFIRLVQAEILANLKKVASGKMKFGVYESHDEYSAWIAKTFLRVYLQLD